MSALPINIELEQIVLGTLLLLPDAVFAVELLETGDFSAGEHRQIFSLIAAAAGEGRHLTPITLAPSIQDLQFGRMTQHQYLAVLIANADGLSQLPSHIGELKQLSGRRALMQIGAICSRFAEIPDGSLSEFLSDTVCHLDDLAAGLRAQKQSLRHFAIPIGERINKLRTGKSSDFIHTGLLDLNRIMGGWHRGELAVVAARTSMGKTAFALSTLRQAAREGTGAVFFSLEISADQASCRLLSDAIWNSQTPLSYKDIDQHKVSDHHIDRLESAAKEIEELPLIIDDQRGLSVSEIGARARKAREMFLRKGQTLDVICIDHLGKICATNRYAGNKVHETGEKSNALAQLALDLNVAVIALHQLNRGPEGREEKRPTNADLRDSGNIEEDADTVAFLYRPAYYLERMKYDDVEKEDKRISMLEARRNVLEYIVSKNRRGPICNKEFFVSIECNVVRDMI